MSLNEMKNDNKNIFCYFLFAANGKATKIRPYLETANIEYFFPMSFKEIKIRDTERKRLTIQPLLGNFLFVKSSKECLDPLLKEIRLRLGITSNLYYRDKGTKKLIIVPEAPMRNFIAVAGSKQDQIIYLSNEEVNLKKGTKVRVIGGIFEGIEGFLMRIRGDRRVVVIIPNLLSVATAYIPPRFILPLETSDYLCGN
jgi:transcription antitermination factor NusG